MLGGGGHPGLPNPRRNATPCDATVCGSLPNSRRSAPMGWLRGAAPGGHVHDRGRIEVNAGPLQLRPHSAAFRWRVPGASSPWVTADGIAAKPGPRSRWTSPPSWSAQMKNRTLAVAAAEAATGRRCYLPDLGQAGRNRSAEHQRAEVIGRDRAGDLGAGGVGDTDQEQLARPLGHGHPGEDPGRAGERFPGAGRRRGLLGAGPRNGRRRGAGGPGGRVTPRGGVASGAGQSSERTPPIRAPATGA